jgi:imidazolonepropionase-like amidohydrolase
MTLFLGLSMLGWAASASGVTAIKAGRVLTVSGEVLENGVVLVENGRIAAVGTDVSIPEGATVVEGGEGVLTPGFIDADAPLGVSDNSNEEYREVTPHLRISAAIWPQAPEFQWARQRGVTAVGVMPGLANVVGGLGAVVKTRGDTVQEMQVRDEVGVLVSLGTPAAWGNIPIRSGRPTSFFWRRPTTGMGVVWEVRKAFFDARRYLEAPDDPTLDPEERRGSAVLARALRGELPVWISARREGDIRTAFRIADEFQIPRWILVECTEGYKLAGEIAERKVPVVVGPLYYYPTQPVQSNEGREICLNNAGILAEAGVPVALTTSSREGVGDLLTHAAFAVRHGLSPEKALRAITLTPAELLGVADRLGSIEVGKDADLVLLSGDPFQATTRILRVWIEGQPVFPTP